MKKILLAAVLTALSSQSWALLFTQSDCTIGTLTVNGGANPTGCEGFIDADQGTANDSEEVMNNTPIYTDATNNIVAFTGFFYVAVGAAQGSNYWDFGQKDNQGGALETDIDLGLSVTEDNGVATWDITDGILGNYDAALAVIKTAGGFDAFLINDSLGDVTGGSFAIDQDSGQWSHFSLYVGSSSVPPDPNIPVPASLPLFALGLALMQIRRSRRAA
jgi:hypothetical protein